MIGIEGMVDFLECPACGKNNRLQDDEDSSKAICAECWTRLNVESRKPVLPPKVESGYTPTPLSSKKEKQLDKWVNLFFVGLFLIVAAAFYIYSSRPKESEPLPSSNEEVVEKYPVVELPKSGALQVFTNRERIAPLTIKTSGSSNYFVKVVSATSADKVMTVFVRGGDTVSTKVPLGSYEIRYASGKQWYGYEHLFGQDTSYSKAENIFKFENQGYQISGYTITLYQVRDGNLRTKRLNASSF